MEFQSRIVLEQNEYLYTIELAVLKNPYPVGYMDPAIVSAACSIKSGALYCLAYYSFCKCG